eukprot:1918143-Amphidinium_carterae.4
MSVCAKLVGLLGTTIIATAPCCVASRASNVALAALLRSFLPQVAAGVPSNTMISLLLGFSSGQLSHPDLVRVDRMLGEVSFHCFALL